jgi:leucine dehydrogenase
MGGREMKGKIFEHIEKYGHEELVFCHDKEAGLKAIIAIYDTTLGPAGGGTRRWVYENEWDAIEDAMRLSRSMTYKYAAAGLNLGGGKAVIMVDNYDQKSESMYRSLGRFVNSLNGRFFTGEDVGTDARDLEYMAMETPHVLGIPDPRTGKTECSPKTAFGVSQGMKACAEEVFPDKSLRDKIVAIQGTGNVGQYLIGELLKEGAKLIVTDISIERLKSVSNKYKGIETVGAEEIYSVKCDIFAPCALGAILNDDTIPKLKCKIVAGSANNQLKEERHGDLLHKMGILYAPDYVINVGGAVDDADSFEKGGYNYERAIKKVARIYDNVRKVISIAKREGVPTYRAADVMVEERLERIRKIKRIGKSW